MVSRLVRDQEAVGSNPTSPIFFALLFGDRAGVIEEVKVVMALEAAVRSLEGRGKSSLTISPKPAGVGAMCQPWIPMSGRSELLTRTAMTESGSLCVRMKRGPR